MKRLLLLLLVTIFPLLAQAQNSQFFSIVLGPTGKPLAGAHATFCSDVSELAIPCTTTINLFDSTGAPISNPVITDGRGNLNAWAPVGVYLLTVSGAGITPYRVVVNFPGGGGGTGIPPGVPGQIVVYDTSTTVKGGTCTDDGVNPTRCPNGMDTASGGNWVEWIVDTGGVVANETVCRTSAQKAQVCAAGATSGVIGIAQKTVSSGGTVEVCFAGKCNVIATNNTTVNDWLIPSTSVAGQVDDVGASKPTTGIQTFPAETSVVAGNAVLTTFLSPDTIGAGGGVGTISPCTVFGLTYYTAPTTVSCITPPTANGKYFPIYDVNANTAVAPTVALSGIATRTVSSSPDTILYSDRTGCVRYTSNSAVAVTLPQAGTTGFTSNYVFCAYVEGAGAVTITPTTSTLTTLTGAALQTGPLTLTAGQFVIIHSPDNVNYEGRTIVFPNQTSIGGIAGTWRNIAGSSYTVVDGDNQQRLRFQGTTVAITLPQPNTVTTNAFVSQRVQSNAQTVNTFTSSSFTPAAGNQLWVGIVEHDNKDITSLTLSTGEACIRESSIIGTESSFVYYCPSMLNSSKTLTVNFSGITGGPTGIFATELTGTTHDNSKTIANGAFTTLSLNNPVHFIDAVSMVADQNGANLFPPWIQMDSLGNANIGEAGYRLLGNTNSVTASVPAGLALVQSILSTSSHASFTAGWKVVLTNVSSTYDVVTSTASTIDGQATLVLAPNQSCELMSNGANWDSICWTTPNLVNDKVAGQPTIVYGRDAAGQTGAIGDTGMPMSTVTPMVFRFAGTINCATSVATATATLNLKWTDTSSTAQTTSVTATCTTLGAASVAHIDQTIRVKANVAPTWGVTIANAPNYDVSVRLENF